MNITDILHKTDLTHEEIKLLLAAEGDDKKKLFDHDGWRQMAKSRNMLSHIYDEKEANAIVRLVFSSYAPLLKSLDEKLERLSQDKEYRQS